MFGFGKKKEEAPAAAPAPEPAGLFEKPAYSTPASPGCGMVTASTEASRTPGTLFDRYGGAESPGSDVHNATHTSRLRAMGIKLVCYLNTEVDRGRSTVVHLPTEEDTIEEVVPYIQRRMQLDKRMKYAKRLYTPNGTPVDTWEQLTDAAQRELPIIVACGEPFDPTTVPPTMVAFQEHGGGRSAAFTVKHELQERRKKAAQLKADQVRATGHGATSTAPKAAKHTLVETNRQQSAMLRHEFMENLLLRAAKQEEIVAHVKYNKEVMVAERQERVARNGIIAKEKAAMQGEQRKNEQAHHLYAKNQAHQAIAAEKAAKAKEIRLKKKEAAALAKEQLIESKKVAGQQRRVSHIARSVQKAELEESSLKQRQAQRDLVKG